MGSIYQYVPCTEEEAKAYPTTHDVINEGRKILAQDPDEVAILTIANEFLDFCEKYKFSEERMLHCLKILCHPETLRMH